MVPVVPIIRTIGYDPNPALVIWFENVVVCSVAINPAIFRVIDYEQTIIIGVASINTILDYIPTNHKPY